MKSLYGFFVHFKRINNFVLISVCETTRHKHNSIRTNTIYGLKKLKPNLVEVFRRHVRISFKKKLKSSICV